MEDISNVTICEIRYLLAVLLVNAKPCGDENANILGFTKYKVSAFDFLCDKEVINTIIDKIIGAKYFEEMKNPEKDVEARKIAQAIINSIKH